MGVDDDKQSWVSWRHYVDTRFEAIEYARAIAHDELKQRLAGMNEIRDVLRDQANTFVSRIEQDVRLEKIDAEIQSLRESRAVLEGKASQSAVMVAMAIAGLSLLMAAVSVIMNLNQ